jgi:hypothetical protein
MRLVSRPALAVLAALLAAAVPAVPAHASDPEMASIDCTGEVVPGTLHAPSLSGPGAWTITCVGGNLGIAPGVSVDPHPLFTNVPMVANWANVQVAPGVYESHGYFTSTPVATAGRSASSPPT